MKLKKGDYIIFIFIILALVLYLFFKVPKHEIKRAVIKIDGTIYKKINLDNTEEMIEDINFMQLVYDKEGIYVKDVICPDKICQKQGKITALGQNIVCLPNKTVIYLEEDN